MTDGRRWAVVLLMAGLASGCGGTLHGQVIDANTRQPVTGAIVVGVWTRCAGIIICRHEFVGVRETQTDEAGWFSLERLPSSGLDGEGDGQAITIYKPGYAAWSNLFLFPSSRLRDDQRVPSHILLEPFPRGQSHGKHRTFIENSARGQIGLGTSPRLWRAVQDEKDKP